MSKKQAHSIWLCPQKQQAVRLSTVIADLTRISGTAFFDPHVTVLGDLQGSPEDTLAACRVATKGAALRMRVRQVASTDAYYMALFLDLEDSPNLTELRDRIANVLGGEKTPFRPHLSLAYGHAPALKDAELRDTLHAEWGEKELVLDTLCVVASAQEVPINQWKMLNSLTLNAGV